METNDIKTTAGQLRQRGLMVSEPGAPSAFTGGITINLASNPTGAAVSGTTVARPVNGIASFSNLSIDKVGTYTLLASASGATSVVSGAFTISTPTAP